jgi:hypothetical protein
MQYRISRGGQEYGPYTLADLQRYVASGHVLLSDLAKSDDMAEWIPVSQVLNPVGAPPAPASTPPSGYGDGPGYAPPVAYGSPAAAPLSPYADPPNLSWGLVLLFDILTCGVFQMVWNLIVAAWMKRVQPTSQAIVYYAVGYALVLVYGGLSFPVFLGTLHHHSMLGPQIGIRFLGFVAWIIRIVARFNMKSSLEEHFNTTEPIGLQLNGILVFFFGGLYLQSQLNRINEIKRAMRYRQFGG